VEKNSILYDYQVVGFLGNVFFIKEDMKKIIKNELNYIVDTTIKIKKLFTLLMLRSLPFSFN